MTFTQTVLKGLHMKLLGSQKLFQDKVLIWAEISENGFSRLYVGLVSGKAVDAYICMCIRRDDIQDCLMLLMSTITEMK